MNKWKVADIRDVMIIEWLYYNKPEKAGDAEWSYATALNCPLHIMENAFDRAHDRRLIAMDDRDVWYITQRGNEMMEEKTG